MLEFLFNKVAGLPAGNFIKKETPAQVFSCRYCEIFKNSFFFRTPPVAASEIMIFPNSLNLVYVKPLHRKGRKDFKENVKPVSIFLVSSKSLKA